MSNGYFLADTNSLVYAYRAGGTKLLDEYIRIADGQQREFAITETVSKEIKDGPLRADLGKYLADRQIPVLSAPDTEQRLRAGTLSPKSFLWAGCYAPSFNRDQAGSITQLTALRGRRPLHPRRIRSVLGRGRRRRRQHHLRPPRRPLRPPRRPRPLRPGLRPGGEIPGQDRTRRHLGAGRSRVIIARDAP